MKTTQELVIFLNINLKDYLLHFNSIFLLNQRSKCFHEVYFWVGLIFNLLIIQER